MDLNALNNLPDEACFKQFQACCTAQNWIEQMVQSRPFESKEQLFETSDAIWGKVDYKGWLEACEGHPKIGDVESLAKKYQSTKEWAGNEQSGMDQANQDVIQRLADGNKKYEEKFGYIFIVCATGKTAEEMLELLEKRLPNAPEVELPIAMAEQNKITRLRLEKLLG